MRRHGLELHLAKKEHARLVRAVFDDPSFNAARSVCQGQDHGSCPKDCDSFIWRNACAAFVVFILKSKALTKLDESKNEYAVPEFIGGRGTLVASLSYAISKQHSTGGWLNSLFGDIDIWGGRRNANVRGSQPVEIWLNWRVLPPHKIRILVDGSEITGAGDLLALAADIEGQFDGHASKPRRKSAEPAPAPIDLTRVTAGATAGVAGLLLENCARLVVECTRSFHHAKTNEARCMALELARQATDFAEEAVRHLDAQSAELVRSAIAGMRSHISQEKEPELMGNSGSKELS